MYPEVARPSRPTTALTSRHPGSTSRPTARTSGCSTLRQPREEVASVEDVDADGVRCRLYTPTTPGRRGRARPRRWIRPQRHRRARRRLPAPHQPGPSPGAQRRLPPTARGPSQLPDDSTPSSLAAREGRRSVRRHGDAAGANLALVARALRTRASSAWSVIYPFSTPNSVARVGRGRRRLRPSEAAWYWEQYARRGRLRDPRPDALRSTAAHTCRRVSATRHDRAREGESWRARWGTGVETVGIALPGPDPRFWRHPHVRRRRALRAMARPTCDHHLSEARTAFECPMRVHLGSTTPASS
jgi:acetyl esterase